MSEADAGGTVPLNQDSAYRIMNQQNQQRFESVAQQRARQEVVKKELYEMIRLRAVVR